MSEHPAYDPNAYQPDPIPAEQIQTPGEAYALLASALAADSTREKEWQQMPEQHEPERSYAVREQGATFSQRHLAKDLQDQHTALIVRTTHGTYATNGYTMIRMPGADPATGQIQKQTHPTEGYLMDWDDPALRVPASNPDDTHSVGDDIIIGQPLPGLNADEKVLFVTVPDKLTMVPGNYAEQMVSRQPDGQIVVDGVPTNMRTIRPGAINPAEAVVQTLYATEARNKASADVRQPYLGINETKRLPQRLAASRAEIARRLGGTVNIGQLAANKNATTPDARTNPAPSTPPRPRPAAANTAYSRESNPYMGRPGELHNYDGAGYAEKVFKVDGTTFNLGELLGEVGGDVAAAELSVVVTFLNRGRVEKAYVGTEGMVDPQRDKAVRFTRDWLKKFYDPEFDLTVGGPARLPMGKVDKILSVAIPYTYQMPDNPDYRHKTEPPTTTGRRALNKFFPSQGNEPLHDPSQGPLRPTAAQRAASDTASIQSALRRAFP